MVFRQQVDDENCQRYKRQRDYHELPETGQRFSCQQACIQRRGRKPISNHGLQHEEENRSQQRERKRQCNLGDARFSNCDEEVERDEQRDVNNRYQQKRAPVCEDFSRGRHD
ncbi:MAG TPA: hypothetical protein DC047_00700 [Blastocatellia bacterium]|nr:hypothetical protein [Blastocatellia bacterium]